MRHVRPHLSRYSYHALGRHRFAMSIVRIKVWVVLLSSQHTKNGGTSLTVHLFWPKFWPKKPLILTEFAHCDRNFDRLCSVGKTLVEIFFWPVGQKILTENLTDWQSVKIHVWPKFWPTFRSKNKFDRNFDRIFGQKEIWPKFWPKIRSKFTCLTEFWPTFRSK